MQKIASILLLLILCGCNEADNTQFMLPLNNNTPAIEEEIEYPSASTDLEQLKHTYDLQIIDIELNKFPEVSLKIKVDPAAGELTADNFSVINGGIQTSATATQLEDNFWTLHYRDIFCGRRELSITVISDDSFGTDQTVYGQNFAILIGIDDYRTKGWMDPYNPGEIDSYGRSPDLLSCVNDVKNLQQTLTNSTMWNGAEITQLIDKQASKRAILNSIEDISHQMNPQDLFLFFFSGHGSGNKTLESSQQYIIAAGYPYISSDKISVNEMADALSPIPSRGLINTVIILDACYSGNFTQLSNSLSSVADPVLRPVKALPIQDPDPEGGSFKKDLEIFSNVIVMSAASGETASYAATKDEINYNSDAMSVYTRFLVEGIRYTDEVSEAPANSNFDGTVTCVEAHNFVAPRALNFCDARNLNPPQSAQLSGNRHLVRLLGD